MTAVKFACHNTLIQKQADETNTGDDHVIQHFCCSLNVREPFMNPEILQREKSLPEGMTIERKSGEIAIEIYDIPLRIPRLGLLWGTPLIMLVIAPGLLGYLFTSGQLRQPERFVQNLPLVIGIFLIIVPILLYLTSSRGRNCTRITKRSGMIEVLYGPIPVPWRPRARSFRVDEIAQIENVDDGGKGFRKISLVLRDSTRFSVGRWPIPAADAVMQQLRSMIG